MLYELSQNQPLKISSDALIVYLFQDEKKQTYVPHTAFKDIDAALHGQLAAVCELEHFSAQTNTSVQLFTQGRLGSSRVVVVGLGKKSAFVLDTLRVSAGYIMHILDTKTKALLCVIPQEIDEPTEEILHVLVEGIELGTYRFEKYKGSLTEQQLLSTIIFSVSNKENISKLNTKITHAQLYTKATRVARDLVNEQSYVATPTYLAQLAETIATSDPRISCTIYNRTQLEKMGMHAFLGIARASVIEPQFIFLEYTPKKSTKKTKLALVGKGITFDSGGINVKTGGHMQDMKMDMAGAACVLGVFSVIGEIAPDFSVIGCIAATPNMISATSAVPGDVVKAYNGKTIEILDTDAEGRVTMADSLSYAVKQGATQILDFATLTGACMVALGTDIAGVFSNNRDILQKVKAAASSAGEKVWELPLEQTYKGLNASAVADIANIPSTRFGGTITAALFLQEFVKDTPWVHFDIAGPAFMEKPHTLGPKGATGFGVRTVLQLLEDTRL